MISLRNFKVQNYLSLRDVDVELGALNVLVGPNGAGKSNFLDALRFIGDTARYDLVEAVDMRGGFDACLFQGAVEPRPSRIRFEVEAEATRYASETAPDEYRLSFWRPRSRALQRSETFTFKRYQGRGRRITVNGGKVELEDEGEASFTQSVATRSAALSTLPKLGEKSGGEQVRQLAEMFETFRVFDPVVEVARHAERSDRKPVLRDDASNLAPYLHWMSKRDPDLFERLKKDMRAILPSFHELHFRPIGGAAEAVEVSVEETGMSRPLPLADTSFGTVRGLALLAMLHDPEPPLLTCIEEVDHGLHPYALDVIVDRLRSASERTQIIAVTHSPALVNRLRPDELVVCERDPTTGETLLPVRDAEEIAEMVSASALRLGELWFSGVLGGVPE